MLFGGDGDGAATAAAVAAGSVAGAGAVEAAAVLARCGLVACEDVAGRAATVPVAVRGGSGSGGGLEAVSEGSTARFLELCG
jgi:hypothetical protein